MVVKAVEFSPLSESMVTAYNGVLGNIVRQTGCTTLLIVERPTGSRVGLGIKETVADGVIILGRGNLSRRLSCQFQALQRVV
jgi:KaiC/GvpD/RAD55 family RecA-like ATPase